MASGSSGHNNSASKGFDFATDDILCSYEDYGNQDSSNGTHSDPVIGSNSAKEFHKSRMARSSMFPAPAYGPPGDSFNEEVISTVEKSMKKYTDNLMRFLEGISSRLSQLELYCYNLDKSIGEMRSDLVRDHGEADLKLKSLDKHLQEILRDKQELAEAQKELAKLQLAQKESSSASHSQQNEDRATPPASDPKRTDNTPDMQLALALPHQVAPQPPLPTRPVEQQQPMPPPPPQSVSQSQAYYLPSAQIQNPPGPAQLSQTQYLPSDSPYRTPQMQDMSRVAPQPAQTQVNQAPQVHQLPQYQQQWAQQVTPPPPSSMQQPQIRPMSTTYPPYLTESTCKPVPTRDAPKQHANARSHVEPMPYGYGGPGRTVQQQQQQPPPQQLKSSFGVQPNDGYTTSGTRPTLSPGNAYMMYEGEAGRAHHPPPPQQHPHFPQGGGYPPASVPLQGPQPNAGPNLMGRPPQFMRNHPYNELIDKLVSMGYRGDHVASVIQRLEESGQPVDFNTVLDRLNGHSSAGGSQRGWSG
ncbi:hypothetical protein HYC85_012156 [Camellia sinensis]|uniref:DUF1421 domain-containing protein n=1 Tax=Camellia sinensis TaxID=4442 RepID=A0A7J7HB47_CAMSI|nr:hypothetical protein HYC85_012156 [Camellia sinensis]